MLIFGVLCFAAAVVLGGWRQACIVFEMRLPHNTPSAWRKPAVQILSWLVVALLSIVGSFILANWVELNLNSVIGNLSFGIFLVARYFLSMWFGGRRAYQDASDLNYE